MGALAIGTNPFQGTAKFVGIGDNSHARPGRDVASHGHVCVNV